ncbi:hypothetical protein [Paraburkholderia sp. MM6662-R1]|uniref:hypothetical protein n=1 Tax=Paraburkholderia sp. MM6662-R1 TaxID=2991066 RepID=UPI003D1D494F
MAQTVPADDPIIPPVASRQLAPATAAGEFAKEPARKRWTPGRGHMGVGMQIVYLGFAGTSQIEAEAASQLVRLERFSRSIAGCDLVIESVHAALPDHRANVQPGDARGRLFEARLDLIMRSGELVPIKRCVDANAQAAIQAAFNSAEEQLACNPVRSRS